MSCYPESCPERGPESLPSALAEYLRAVRDELARRGIVVSIMSVSAAEPTRALSGCLRVEADLDRPLPAHWPSKAVWHEELGWWVELDEAPARPPSHRFMSGRLVPEPAQAAEFIAQLTLGQDVGADAPVVHRYCLISDERELRDQLVAHAPAPLTHL